MRMTLTGLIHSHAGFFQVFSAESNQAVYERLSKQPIHLIISGFHVPEKDCLDLLNHVSKSYPQIRMIVLTHQASSVLRNKIRQIHAATNFDHPLDLNLFIPRILTELHIDSGGQLRGISLSSFLQLLEQEERTCVLLISANAKKIS